MTIQRIPRIPVRDFFKNPEYSSFHLSPDGSRLGYLKPWEGRMNLFVRPVGGGAERRLTAAKDRDLAGFFWKENEHILYVRDFAGDENYHVYSVDVGNGREKDLTPWDKVRAGIVDDLDNIAKDEVLLSNNRRDPKVFDVFRVNIRTGESKKIAENPGNIVGWLTDHRGQLRVAAATDGVNNKILYRDRESQPFRVIKTLSFKDKFLPQFFTFDNKRLFAVSNLDRDKSAAVEYDPHADKELRIVYQHPDYDTDGLRYSKERRVLTAATLRTWKSQAVYLDPLWDSVHQKVLSRVGDDEPHFISWDRREDRCVIIAYSDRSRGSYYLCDVPSGKLTLLARLGRHLPVESMASMKPIEYQSRDGLTIRGYLTLPKGVAPRRLPVVVNPHGGPWARDSWGYNPEVQFLANRGYAVLQMNFRGSTGYGKKFWKASFKQWGKKMQDDVTDGILWLEKQGIADPKRVCIYGGSYGGYAALAGLAFTPDLYACGVDYVGVSNLFTFLNTIPPYWKPLLDQLREMVGDPVRDKDLLAAASPALHAGRIRAPLFIAQGAKDPRVNKAESDQMVAALKKRGVAVDYLVKENEGHGFHNEENRFEFYEEMERFLAKHLGAVGA